MPKLFVVVSTGQNVANLPPLLEHGRPGDRVGWVESNEALARKWSAGARSVLPRFGFVMVEPDILVQRINDPTEVAAACTGAVTRCRQEGWTPYLVLNGGQKLTPVGLTRAWESLQPMLLYGDERPAVCSVSRLNQPATVGPYTHHQLDLEDILTTSGHRFSENNAGCKLWPGPLPADIAGERYGLDAGFTTTLHQQMYDRHAVTKGGELPQAAAVRQMLPDRFTRWGNPIATWGLAHPQAPPGPGLLDGIFNGARRLLLDGREAQQRAGLAVPDDRLGGCFEAAVARRVHGWLEATRHPAIQSAWFNIKVARNDHPTRNTAELDVVLVLRNGILWHLECKSAVADAKDLDARVLNLQKAGSLHARMAVCVPILTASATTSWFRQLHELKERITAHTQLQVIPFTLPGQPGSYTLPDGTVKECPTFEEELGRQLQGYRAGG